MTVIEKKKIIKKIIESLPDENLDEAILLVEDLVSKDLNRKEYLIELLKTENNLFEKLAQ